MSLQEQGYRYIIRPLDGRIDGRWVHPAEVKPEWLDCTDMEDDVFASNVRALQLWLENRREQV
jgi:hypothetical protein